MPANRFLICNMAAKATRKLHKPSGDVRVEEDLKMYTAESERFLLSGTPEEVELKNLRGRSAVVWFNN